MRNMTIYILYCEIASFIMIYLIDNLQYHKLYDILEKIIILINILYFNKYFSFYMAFEFKILYQFIYLK